ncbi:MAG: TIM barrel protein [Sedimentisphaerales bacterium]|jgi:hydroxypyruvate isomerase
MDRRGFIAAAVTAGVAAISNSRAENKPASPAGKFKLKYAPELGKFEASAGSDLIDQLKFFADEGFSAMFDNYLSEKPVELQGKIAKQCQQLGLAMGPFIACAEFGRQTLVLKDNSVRDAAVAKIKVAIEVSKRTGCKMGIVVPGRYAVNQEWGYQTANVIDNLKFLAGVCEKDGFVMVIESLNNWKDHPGMFLSKIPQAYQICRAVNSSSCKILDDLYHQQITEGNLIPNMDMAWEEIAVFHLGDTPGRNEPTTGEINYRNIFKHIYGKEYKGVLCMEHGKSKPGKEGERAVIEAYRWCDDF